MGFWQRSATQCVRQTCIAHSVYRPRQFSVLSRAQDAAKWALAPEEATIVTMMAKEKRTDNEIAKQLPQLSEHHIYKARRRLGLPEDPTKIERPHNEWELAAVAKGFKEGKSDEEILASLIEERRRKLVANANGGDAPVRRERSVRAIKKMRVKQGLFNEAEQASYQAYLARKDQTPSSTGSSSTGGSVFGGLFGKTSNPQNN